MPRCRALRGLSEGQIRRAFFVDAYLVSVSVKSA